MAHEVNFSIESAEIGHKDLKIVVSDDEGKVGTLLISKGNIEWLPTGNSVNKRSLKWRDFADLMEEKGQPARKAKRSRSGANEAAAIA